MKVDGTMAKTIAIHFLDRTQERFTPSIVAKTIIQTKSIMKSGYTSEEIIKVIDYIVDETNVEMYSIGYVSSAINDVLKEIKKRELEEEVKVQMEKLKSEKVTTQSIEGGDCDSKERNKEKVNRFGPKSRKRKKPYSDLFE